SSCAHAGMARAHSSKVRMAMVRAEGAGIMAASWVRYRGTHGSETGGWQKRIIIRTAHGAATASRTASAAASTNHCLFVIFAGILTSVRRSRMQPTAFKNKQ
ncbi:MAG: hypothetical protein RR376_24465, partial [Janthinobacterium sp.]